MAIQYDQQKLQLLYCCFTHFNFKQILFCFTNTFIDKFHYKLQKLIMSESDSKNNNQNDPAFSDQEQSKITKEQAKRIKMQQRKAKLMPFYKFLKKNGLKFKTARCQKQRVQYFRVNALKQIIQARKQQLQNDKALRKVYFDWEKHFIYYNRPENLPNMKYPQILQHSKDNQLAKFASFKFDTSQSKKWMFPLIIVGVVAAVLFPLWPYAMKYVVWLIALYLLCAIVGLIIVRLVVYLFCAIFGISFWILPNFFGDYGFLQSFVPIYSFTKWQIGAFNLIGRLLALSIFGYYAYHLYLDPSWVFENLSITKTSIDELHDWGVSKIKGQKNFSQSALTNIDTIMNQTADAHQQMDLDLQDNINQNDQKDEQLVSTVNNQDQQNIKGSQTQQKNVVEANQQQQFDENDPGL